MRNNLDTASLILQIYNLVLLMQDFNNADLMKEINVVIEQNEEILEILKRKEE